MPRDRLKKRFELRKRFLSEIVPTSEHDNFYDSSLVSHYGKVDAEGNIVYQIPTRPLATHSMFSTLWHRRSVI
jgi:hypothetical protein